MLENGFVPVEEIYNVRTEFMTKMEEQGYSRDHINFVETLFLELAKRAKRNLEDAKKRGTIGVQDEIKKKADEEESAKKNRDEWRRRTALGREYAK